MALTSSPRSAPPVVLGSQTPRLCQVPEYVSSAGEEAIECAALAGLHLDPWERFAITNGCGERPDGKWAAFEVGVEAPRQNGKGSILETRELGGIFAFGEKLLIHSAHEQLTATNHFNRMLDLMEGVPEFERRILKAVRGKGSESIAFRGGQSILFKTRTGGGGRGLTGDFVALDEAMILPIATTGALVPTMAARSITGNPQLWYAWSAVDKENQKHDGVVVTRLRQRALAGVSGLAYFCWSADVQAWLEARGLPFDSERSEIEQVTAAMLDDPEMWAQANPGLGIRIALEHIRRERAGALGPREFAVERLGITDPPDTSDDVDRKIGADVWVACAEHDQSKRVVGSVTFAVDMNVSQTWGSVAGCGRREDERWQGRLFKRERGDDWIVECCSEIHVEYPEAEFVLDKRGPASHLIQDLKDAGLAVVEVSFDEYVLACAGFFEDVTHDRFRYPAPQPEFENAVADAREQKVGDRWKWGRRTSTSSDISPLVALTLAHWGAQNPGGVPTVWNLADFVGDQQPEQPEPAPQTPQQGQSFIPFDQAPVHRGLFRP